MQGAKPRAVVTGRAASAYSMIRKSMLSRYDPTGGCRLSLATNAECVCAEIMLKELS